MVAFENLGHFSARAHAIPERRNHAYYCFFPDPVSSRLLSKKIYWHGRLMGICWWVEIGIGK